MKYFVVIYIDFNVNPNVHLRPVTQETASIPVFSFIPENYTYHFYTNPFRTPIFLIFSPKFFGFLHKTFLLQNVCQILKKSAKKIIVTNI